MMNTLSLGEKGRTPFRTLLLPVAAICLASLIPFALAAVLALHGGVPVSTFTRDPLAVAEAPFYLGFTSNLGIMIWSAATGLVLFAGYRLHSGTPKGRFLIGAGWLSLVLAADDMFMLHEAIEGATGLYPTVLYGAAVLYGLWRFRTLSLSRAEWLGLGCALAAFAMSVGIDALPHDVQHAYVPGSAFIEDAFKFLGVSLWMLFSWHAAVPDPSARTAQATVAPVTPEREAYVTPALANAQADPQN